MLSEQSRIGSVRRMIISPILRNKSSRFLPEEEKARTRKFMEEEADRERRRKDKERERTTRRSTSPVKEEITSMAPSSVGCHARIT
jgi:hypothetical protein